MSTVSSPMDDLVRAVEAALEDHNQTVDDFNSAAEQNYLLRQKLAKAEQQIEDMLKMQQNFDVEFEKHKQQVTRERAERKQMETELRELRKLDPNRLAKVNKEQKKRITALKESLDKCETARKEALKQHKIMLTKQQDHGKIDVYVDPETGNAIRLLGTLAITKGNEFGGVPGTPVLEFFHKASGVSRQGTLLTDGTIGWADAKHSLPADHESKIAKEQVLQFCSRHKIKLPKEVK